jgi:septum formation protein|tara:strand:+ start:45 stop:635 length:591 start_codon:yes stop_codon:yes gene_type:complete
MILNKQFILASNSASRKMLLKNAGLKFFSEKPLCNEDYIKDQLLKKNTKKTNLPKLLAEAKALSVSENNTKYLVVGSDTIILFNNTIINKAKTMKEAKKKLQKLSGKKHQIISGASVCLNNKQIWSYQQTSTIHMNALNQKQINTYLEKTGKNILSSVGCYQVERLGPQIIKSIKGDFFNVLGFPLFPFLTFLSKR